METKCPFLVSTEILGFLSIFKKSQASSPFEALNSTCLLRCQRDVRTPLQMRQRPRAFCRVSTGVSDTHSCCEMKVESAFLPLQGNPSFFRVRASRGPFHYMQKTQGTTHIPIAESKFLLRCLWKVAYLFSRRQGFSSHLEMIWGAPSFPRVAVLKLMFL